MTNVTPPGSGVVLDVGGPGAMAITIDTTAISGGTANELLYIKSAKVGSAAGLAVITGGLTLGAATGISRISDGVVGVGNGTAGDFSGALKAQTVTAGTLISGGSVEAGAANFHYWSTRALLSSPADGQLNMLKNAGTTGAGLDFVTDGVLQVRVIAQNAFGTLKAILQTSANATTGLAAGVLAATTNASLVITDGSGQVYRVPCII